MKITFVYPNLNALRSPYATEPLVFAVLAGLTPPDVQVVLYDDRIEPTIPYDEPTDLVALTVETFTARRAYQIASRFRDRGVPVVMGGYHPTFLPAEALQHADAVVVGDAEGVWKQLIRDARQHKLRRIYRQESVPSLKGLEFDRRIFEGKRYVPVAAVQFGRGCRYACEFCSVRAFYGSNLRQRPVREVVAEIEALDRKFIFLVDDNIFVDVPKAEELFRALAPLNIRWGSQVSVDVANDARLMDLMANSGCIATLVGFETLNDRNLAQMKKKWNVKNSDYRTVVRGFRDRGIMVFASFVFGYDHDTVDAFDATLEFALRSKFMLANFIPLNPMPGSRVYERLREEGRLIFDRWWLDPDYRFGQASFHPRGMTADELTAGCTRVRREFYRYTSTLKRVWDRQANCRNLHQLGFFLALNHTARREIARTQRHPLGIQGPLALPLEGP